MGKLNLMICPHDTAKNPEKWFRFVQYLNHHLDFIVHFTISLDFKEFHDRLSTADLVYANPADGAYLVKNDQFIPIVRSTNLSKDIYDELSLKTKEMITEIASSENKAFHALYLSPKVGDRAQAISSALQKMHLDPMRQDVLKDLKMEAWESLPVDALQSLFAIVG